MPKELCVAVLVTAAGKSERFGGVKKELQSLGDSSVLDRSIKPFLGLPRLSALVVTAPPGREGDLAEGIAASTRKALEKLLGPRFFVVAGGETRRDSVRRGLEALAASLGPDRAADCLVLIHDAARPWASASLAARVAEVAAERGACVPVVPLVDTPKRLEANGTIGAHLSRESLGSAQTPQGFRLLSLLEAHRRALAEGMACTDDAELWARYAGPVAWTEGELSNKKITFPEDLPGAEGAGSGTGSGGAEGASGQAVTATAAVGAARRRTALPFRLGQGWDVHTLAPGRPLLIGGVALPSELGEDAHSDGDVLLHAIIDALLGAAALGDIGTHFPPSDAAWRGADSRQLLARAVALVREAGWEPGNLDCTVILERPRLGPHRQAICESVAACLGLDTSAVSVKAKTNEGLGEVGSGRAVEASAVVTLFPR